MHSLSELTEGYFADLSEVTSEKITDYFRAKRGEPDLEIPIGNDAPMFNKDGEPILKANGEQLCLPYTHACLLVYDIMAAAGKADAGKTSDVRDLPVFFWRSSDVYLVTEDEHVILGQRSNFNENAPGLCLFTAAGFAKVIDGVAETAEASAKRELEEETGLSGEMLEFIFFGRDFDNGINTYPITTNKGIMQGRVPTFADKWAVRAAATADHILQKITSNGESLGFLALLLRNLDPILSGPKKINVVFAAATQVLKRMTYKDKAGCLNDRIKPHMTIASLRDELDKVIRPQDYDGQASLAAGDAAVDSLSSGLASPIKAKFSRGDTAYGATATSPLEFIRRAAITCSPLPPRPYISGAGAPLKKAGLA